MKEKTNSHGFDSEKQSVKNIVPVTHLEKFLKELEDKTIYCNPTYWFNEGRKAILKDIEEIRSTIPVYMFIENPEVNAMINGYEREIKDLIKRGMK